MVIAGKTPPPVSTDVMESYPPHLAHLSVDGHNFNFSPGPSACRAPPLRQVKIQVPLRHASALESPGKKAPRDRLRLTLGVLEAFARAGLAVLLALADARVAGEETKLLELFSQVEVVFQQRARDS